MISFLLILLGLVVGVYGTLVGLGGGFLLVPLLLFLYPHESPKTITSISLAVVFFNALSGSIAYIRLRRINYRIGLVFGAMAVPTAAIGALIIDLFPRRIFEVIFGSIITTMAILLWLHPKILINPNEKAGVEVRSNPSEINYPLATALGFGTGFISSLLGIGGGIIQVPALIHFFHFPVHMATATSLFMMTLMSFSAVTAHLITGEYSGNLVIIAFLTMGVMGGSQWGARISQRLEASFILHLLALALGFVGLGLIYRVI